MKPLALALILVPLFAGVAHAQVATSTATTTEATTTNVVIGGGATSGVGGGSSPQIQKAFYIQNLKNQIIALEKELLAVLEGELKGS